MIEIAGMVAQSGDFRLRADLAIPKGAFCALIGPSGGGKSTLLLAIAGFVPVTAGRVTVAGRDLAGLAPAARPVSLLFQDNNLFPHLTVAQNVGLGLRPDLKLNAAQEARVAAALAETGLHGLGPRLPDQLSGGQRQRAALARALLRDRPALLLDEPFAALGPGLRAEMLALVRATALPRGIAVLMVTHHPGDAQAADLAAFCASEGDAGRIDGARAPAALFADPPPGLADYLGATG